MSCSHNASELDLVCIHIAAEERPVLQVWRYLDDGRWGYDCGKEDHPKGSYVWLCRGCGQESLKACPGYTEFENLKPGYEAWRDNTSTATWHVQEMK